MFEMFKNENGLILREIADPKFDVKQFEGCYSRAVPVVNGTFDENELSIESIVATELPVLVFDWLKWQPVREILLMKGAKIPASKQIIALNNHSRFSLSDVIGSTRNIELEKGVKLSKDYTGDILVGKLFLDSGEEKIIRLVKEKHLTDTSIGYRTYDNKTLRIMPGESGAAGGRTFKNDFGDEYELVIRTEWDLFENSLTPVGADKLTKLKSQHPAVVNDKKFFVLDVKNELGEKIDYKLENSESENKLNITINNSKKELEMNEEERLAKEKADKEKAVRELQAGIDAELKRRDNINATCERLQLQTSKDLTELKNEFLADKSKTPMEFFDHVSEKVLNDPKNQKNIPDLRVGLSNDEKRDYSIRKIILYSLGAIGEKEVGVELAADKVLRDQLGNQMQSEGKSAVLIPEDIMNRRRVFNIKNMRSKELELLGSRAGLLVGSDAAGGYTVQDQYIAQSFIDYLVNSMAMNALGVQIITGLKGVVPMVRELDDYTYYHAAEGSGITQSEITFGEERVAPNKAGALARYSYEFLNQTSLAVEAYIERRLAGVCGRGFDYDLMYGTGSGQPKGLKNWTGVGATVGAGFTREKTLSMESSIDTANASDLGTMKFASKPAVRSVLKNIKVDAGSGRFLCNDENEMIGYDYGVVSNMFAAGDLAFGVWSQMLAMYWDMLQIKASEFDDDAFKAGDVLVRALQFVDSFVVNPAAFNIATNVAK